MKIKCMTTCVSTYSLMFQYFNFFKTFDNCLNMSDIDQIYFLNPVASTKESIIS